MNSTRNKKIYEELVRWSEQYDWDVFGTLTFAPKHKLQGDEAQQLFRPYWNGINQAQVKDARKSAERLRMAVHRKTVSGGWRDAR